MPPLPAGKPVSKTEKCYGTNKISCCDRHEPVWSWGWGGGVAPIRDIFLDFIFKILIMYMCVSVRVSPGIAHNQRCPRRLEEGIGFPGAEVTNDWEPLTCRHREWKMGSL